jgi:hypothetical protein
MIIERDRQFIRFRRRLAAGAAAAALIIGWVGPGYAAEATIDEAVAGLAPMSAAELGEQRGGFTVGPVTISFGFAITTSISGGALGPGVTVTTNFTVNTPGALQNLGTTVTSNVNAALADGSGAADGNPPAPAGAGGVVAGNDPALPTPLIPGPETFTPPTTPDPGTASVGSTVPSAPDSGGAVGPANPDSAAPAFTLQLDTQAGTIALAAGPDTSVVLQYVQGQLTKIENSNNDVQIQNHVSANYVIENYQDIAGSADLHSQLSNLSNQLIALDGLDQR